MKRFKLEDAVWNDTRHSTFRVHLCQTPLLFQVVIKLLLADDLEVFVASIPAAFTPPGILALPPPPSSAANMVEGTHHIHPRL